MRQETTTMQTDTVKWLEAQLAAGAVLVKKLKADAPCSWSTVRLAAEVLGVEAVKPGFNRGWAWRLPRKREGAQENPPIGGGSEHLREIGRKSRFRLTQAVAAQAVGASVRSIQRARFVQRYGLPELSALIELGTIKLACAERIARLSEERQRRFLELIGA